MGSLFRWLVFLAVFLCLYGSLHLYVLIKVRRSLYLEGWSYILLVIVLAFLMLAPILARLLESQGNSPVGLLLTWIGYVWMGYVFLFVCIAIPVDTYHLAVGGLQRLLDVDWTDYMLMRRQSLMLVAAAAGVLTIYGAIAAHFVGVQHVTLPCTKLPGTMERLRIVQISALHLGPMLYPGRLEPILAAVGEAKPDLLVCTGDLIDGPLDDSAEIAQLFKALPASLGKFAVLGNHEYYLGLSEATKFIEAAGFQLLRGAYAAPGQGIAVAGVDDPAGRSTEGLPESQLLAQIPADQLILLLKHRPLIDAGQSRFDLQLSGHVHNGQIFPFSLAIKMLYPFTKGLYAIAPAAHLYVSPGTGTWGPP
ncbi:MAG: metallophosphoesterase, partial [Desulfatitalea sp.]|nr:metallophosphoesterase [Desulfatitalea sp.]